MNSEKLQGERFKLDFEGWGGIFQEDAGEDIQGRGRILTGKLCYVTRDCETERSYVMRLERAI